MTYDRITEVEALLEADETTLGHDWRQTEIGLGVEEIAAQRGVQAGPVYSNLGVIRALRDGEVATAPFVAARDARRLRSWLKSKPMSDELRAALIEQEHRTSANVGNEAAAEHEIAEAVKATETAEASGTPGVYVYTLPHYLKYPVDAEMGKTLLKVGHSSTDAYFRVNSQGRFTSLPEEPVLLRIYPAEQSAGTEKVFHEWLHMADHRGARTRRAGAEWFLTSTKFLDHVASSLNLEIRVIVDREVGDE